MYVFITNSYLGYNIITMSEISNNTTSTAKLVTITVEDTDEEAGAVKNSTDSTTSFCAEGSDLHGNHLQVPKNPTLLDDKMDAHISNETLHNSLRSSVRNIAAEVFTTQNITTAVKCRLMATLIVIICVMILLFLAPIVWYNTDPPSAETYATKSTVFYNLEIESGCIVSAYYNVHGYIFSYHVFYLPYLVYSCIHALGYLSSA